MNKLIILVVLACVLGSLAQSSTDKRSQCKFYRFMWFELFILRAIGIFEQRSWWKAFKEQNQKVYH